MNQLGKILLRDSHLQGYSMVMIEKIERQKYYKTTLTKIYMNKLRIIGCQVSMIKKLKSVKKLNVI